VLADEAAAAAPASSAPEITDPAYQATAAMATILKSFFSLK
jgi:hypothetical protein